MTHVVYHVTAILASCKLVANIFHRKLTDVELDVIVPETL